MRLLAEECGGVGRGQKGPPGRERRMRSTGDMRFARWCRCLEMIALGNQPEAEHYPAWGFNVHVMALYIAMLISYCYSADILLREAQLDGKIPLVMCGSSMCM